MRKGTCQSQVAEDDQEQEAWTSCSLSAGAAFQEGFASLPQQAEAEDPVVAAVAACWEATAVAAERVGILGKAVLLGTTTGEYRRTRAGGDHGRMMRAFRRSTAAEGC